ncbi:MAG: 16S rRNA (guanine(966)-N(2))-methyltransferase RsmD [Tenericutes bacterium]|nr:MAG: 16S rRNA (guanine(966)-N(2))-methyltransferase RsmD [Mycoplasmatota bacterium]
MKLNFGKYKNQSLKSPKNPKMRPTTAIAKSKIFNSHNVEGHRTLDLFAGTGALSFEAISLGATKAYVVDTNFESFKAIKESAKTLGIDKDVIEIYKTDFRRALKKVKNIDTIFLDPPFGVEKYYGIALEEILKNDVLAPGGTIIMEKPRKTTIIQQEQYKITLTKKIGEKEIIFLQNHD